MFSDKHLSFGGLLQHGSNKEIKELLNEVGNDLSTDKKMIEVINSFDSTKQNLYNKAISILQNFTENDVDTLKKVIPLRDQKADSKAASGLVMVKALCSGEFEGIARQGSAIFSKLKGKLVASIKDKLENSQLEYLKDQNELLTHGYTNEVERITHANYPYSIKQQITFFTSPIKGDKSLSLQDDQLKQENVSLPSFGSKGS